MLKTIFFLRLCINYCCTVKSFYILEILFVTRFAVLLKNYFDLLTLALSFVLLGLSIWWIIFQVPLLFFDDKTFLYQFFFVSFILLLEFCKRGGFVNLPFCNAVCSSKLSIIIYLKYRVVHLFCNNYNLLKTELTWNRT